MAAANEEAGRSEAFRLLVRYIFGGNLERADIAMTSPVATGAAAATVAGRSPAAAPLTSPVERGADRNIGVDIPMTTPVVTAGAPGGVTMRFFLPSKITPETVPVPNDGRVKIVRVPEETVAALAFAGWGTESAIAEKKRALLTALADSAWRAAEEPYTLFYDPPFTIPFLRRNEVAVRVTRG